MTAVLLLRWFNPLITLTQCQSVLSGYSFHRKYRKLEELPVTLRLAVIAAEDQRFMDHDGFDLRSIETALAHNQKGGTLRGGSTISQQVAKNVFLWQGRTWLRKGLETLFTMAIEQVWGKRRILEMYLNVAEMGPGVFGAQAAAQYYFGVDASALSDIQAALIAASLPSPTRMNPAAPSAHMKRKAEWIRQQSEWLRTRKSLTPLLESAPPW